MSNRTDFLITLSSPWVNVFFSTNNCGWLLFPQGSSKLPSILARIAVANQNRKKTKQFNGCEPQQLFVEEPFEHMFRACVSKGSDLYSKKGHFTTCAGVPPAVKKLSEFCNEFCWFYVLSLHFALFLLDLSLLIAVFPECNLKPKSINLWILHDTLI